MPGRKYSSGNYRYGFNGQEKSDEIFEGSTTAEFWEYDSRIGRRWNIDPIFKEFESPYSTMGGNPVAFSDYFGLDWGTETSGTGKNKKTILKSDVGDDIKGFEDWYKKSGLNLSKDQYNKLHTDVETLLNNSKKTIYDRVNVTMTTIQGSISYNLSDNILNFRLHVGLENGPGLYGQKDGHVGIEFQGKVYNYFWDRGTTFSHFQSNPFATWPGLVRVDGASDYMNGGNGDHRSVIREGKNGKTTGLYGTDYYAQINLDIDTYRSLSNTLLHYDDPANRTGSGVPNYGFFKRQFGFFGVKQARCMSWCSQQLDKSGINFGMIHFKFWKTISPKKLKDNVEKAGHKFTQVPSGVYSSQW